MILALDVGFANMGYVAIEGGRVFDAGVIETTKSTKKTTRVADDYADRAATIALRIDDLAKVRGVSGIVGELPSGGAQNARAMAMMSMATATVSAVAAIKALPCEWCTPTDVKLAMTGFRSATKQMIMEKAIVLMGGHVQEKTVKCRATKNCPDGVRTNCTYVLNGFRWGAGDFEHIADAFGAYQALRQNNLVKMFG